MMTQGRGRARRPDRRGEHRRARPAGRQRRLRRPAERRRRGAARLLLHARAEEARRRRGLRSKACAPRRWWRKAVMEHDRPSPPGRQGRAGFRARHGLQDRGRPQHREFAQALAGMEAPDRPGALPRSARARRGGSPASALQMVAEGLIDPRAPLRHDQLRRHQRQGRDLRRDHDQRPGLEDPRPRRRLADPRRRALRGRRGRRRRLDRPRRGQPLQSLLVPDRRGRCAAACTPRMPAWRRSGARGLQHRRETPAERSRQAELRDQLLHPERAGEYAGVSMYPANYAVCDEGGPRTLPTEAMFEGKP